MSNHARALDVRTLEGRSPPLASGRASPVRVLVVARGFSAGGAERQLLELLASLDPSRVSTLVACFYRGEWHEQAAGIDGIRVVHLGKLGRYDVIPSMSRLYREASSFCPEVVYSYAGAADVPVLLLSRLLGAKAVWSIRNAEPRIDIDDWLPPFLRTVSSATARFVDGVIANSRAGAEAYAGAGYPEDRISIIPNGTDTNRFRRDRHARELIRQGLGLPDHVLLVGLVARIDKRKGHSFFLEAAARLAASGKNYHFVCAGSGDPNLLLDLKRRASQLHLDERVHWLGHVDDVVAAYNACDIIALPSSTEGFPNVLCEAMACEVPCVASAVGDTRAILGEVGATVPPGDAASLAREIERLAMCDLEAIGRQLRGRVVKEFSLEAMAESTMRYFERAAAAGRAH